MVPELSASARRGAGVFDANCAACHGKNAAGTQQGPPLIHKIYEPNHHSDMSFQRAVKLGVRAHHWPFGNMPPVAGVAEAEVSQIIAYVRELQRANGIQ
jgi:mono/diheme cytochrome c family protein